MAAKKEVCEIKYYFDANSHTQICKEACDEVIKYVGHSFNPSSDSKAAEPFKKMIEKTENNILKHCKTSNADYYCIFTSGATESNCAILRMTVKAFKAKLSEKGLTHIVPHIITSKTEHSSIIDCLADLERAGQVSVTYLAPTIYGNITPESVKEEIKDNTCLISIMYANNELPVINNISAITEIAKSKGIPLHTDAVQVFGKYPINLGRLQLDALTASAHKFYGPLGIGVLILKKTFVDEYGLTGEINGKQQNGLRAGTENLPGIAGFGAALAYVHENRRGKNDKQTKTNRQIKNDRLMTLRNLCVELLSEWIPQASYDKYIELPDQKDDLRPMRRKPLELVFLGPPAEEKSAFLLCNTILVSIAKNTGSQFCNIMLKKFLDQHKCIISIGSACNTKSQNASHVLGAIMAPPVIKRGVIRISFHDKNTKEEVYYLVEKIIEGIKKQCGDIKDELQEAQINIFPTKKQSAK